MAHRNAGNRFCIKESSICNPKNKEITIGTVFKIPVDGELQDAEVLCGGGKQKLKQ